MLVSRDRLNDQRRQKQNKPNNIKTQVVVRVFLYVVVSTSHCAWYQLSCPKTVRQI